MNTEAYAALSGYYGNYDEHARLASQHGSIEFLTTVRYVEKYLKNGMRILEIGAGTGRYSHYYARRGYEVDAVELMPHNIDEFSRHTQTGEKVRIFEGSAVDMPFIESGAYDIVLLLGPMYHLFTKEEQMAALSEAIRTAKTGGVIFAAYCGADAAIMQAGFLRRRVRQLIADKMLDPETFHTHSDPKDIFELYRRQDIDGLMTNFPVKRLHFIGTDMAGHYMRDAIDAMDRETFETYLKYHFSICERPDLVGASNHFLDVFRKEAG